VRARIIKPGFFDDPKLGQLPIGARLLFVGLWCCADREGVLMDIPRRIAAEVFPHDQFEDDVERWLHELVGTRCIVRYEVDGVKCIYIQRFKEHQNIHPNETKSRLPAPPSDVITMSRTTRDIVTNHSLHCNCSITSTSTSTSKAACGAAPTPPPRTEDDGPAVKDIRSMLVEFTKGRLGEPDSRLCLKLLNFAGGDPQRVENWLRTKIGKRGSMTSWGWFVQAGEAELREPQAKLLDISTLVSAKAMPQ